MPRRRSWPRFWRTLRPEPSERERRAGSDLRTLQGSPQGGPCRRPARPLRRGHRPLSRGGGDRARPAPAAHQPWRRAASRGPARRGARGLRQGARPGSTRRSGLEWSRRGVAGRRPHRWKRPRSSSGWRTCRPRPSAGPRRWSRSAAQKRSRAAGPAGAGSRSSRPGMRRPSQYGSASRHGCRARAGSAARRRLRPWRLRPKVPRSLSRATRRRSRRPTPKSLLGTADALLDGDQRRRGGRGLCCGGQPPSSATVSRPPPSMPANAGWRPRRARPSCTSSWPGSTLPVAGATAPPRSCCCSTA